MSEGNPSNVSTQQPLAWIPHLQPGEHLCWLYDSEQDHQTVMSSFLRQGLEEGQKVLCILDSHDEKTVLDYLPTAPQVDPCRASNRVVFTTSSDAYMRESVFAPEEMIALLRAKTERAIQEGHPALRVSGEMSWSLRGHPGSERLIEYESKLNTFRPVSKCLIICQYDTRQFDADVLLKVLACHPLVIVGTKLYENFYYIPPENLLPEEAPAAALRNCLGNLEVRARMEATLWESEEKYRTLFEQSKDAIFLTSRDGEFIGVNDSMLELVGYTREELLRIRVEDTHVDPAQRSALRQEIEENGSVHEYELKLRKRNGTEIVCLETATARRSAEGEVLGYQGILRDITDHRMLEEQLRQAQKMEAVGHLAGGVAHDFNNLLTGMTGYVQLALGKMRPESPQVADLRKVLDLAGRAAGLTQQLLAFSRRQQLETKVLNLNTVVEGFSKMLERIIGEDLETEFIAAADLGNVRADPGQVEQVLLNLAVNARDAMPEGGKLTIETANVVLDEDYCRKHAEATPGRHVMLAVTDTGWGMEEETRQQIFEPFFTTKKSGEGTGLGLATVYGIVKQHGGNIWVYSEPGRGTTFKVHLPRVEEEADEISSKIEAAPAARAAETILIVEDQEDVRIVAQRGLEDHGYRVLVATGACEAEELFSKHSGEIDLLLTDVVMPEMDGPTLYRRLSEVDRSLKALYMSGYARRAISRNELVEPRAAFISKPFAPPELAQKVREVLDA